MRKLFNTNRFKPNLTNISLLILTTVSLLSLLLFVNNLSQNKKESLNKVGTNQFISKDKLTSEQEEKMPNWIIYRNSEYGFTFKIPPFLSKEEIKNQAHYESFIKFNKNQFSFGDSVYVGVTRLTLDDEVEKVTSLIKNQSKQDPNSEENLDVLGANKAKAINYLATESTEAMAVFFAQGNNVTISISSTPDQIEVIKESFSFFN
ncbi:MAG: hypothetical protein NZM26_00725 [Patescibacteria group bacterium]|nr:hypothetical protein [Patescibacteria group bacterium]